VRCAGTMRYRDGGRLTAAERARREQVRLAAELIDAGARDRFTETDYARLLDGAHQQLARPIVLVRDNLPTHISRARRQLIAARSWLTVFQLPAYAPELNPVEAI
jgi:DDE superfamily endonuclease